MLINLTPHEINLYRESVDEMIQKIPPSGQIARVGVTRELVGYTGEGIPLYKTAMGEIENLPPRKRGFTFVVSAMVAMVAKRKDVVSPGDLLRDESGKPVGCKGLTVWK